MRYLLLSATVLLFCALLTTKATHPPEFIEEPSEWQRIFEVGDTLTLPWRASCDPACIYTWEFNGKPFDPAGTDDRVVPLAGTGSLVFAEPESQFSGFYKCFATNDFGTAVSDTVQLINASLGFFPDTTYPTIRKIAGDPLRIICNRPESFPLATIVWAKKGSQGSINVDYNDRVTVDPDGGLNFAYVTQEDAGEYQCIAYNAFLRKEVNSKPHKLEVSGSVGDSQSPPTKDNWVARTSETFVRGHNASIKCIYAGNPVPGVIWRRTDGKDLSVRTQVRSFGLELSFAGIDYNDAGSYECDGYNAAQPTPIKTTVLVNVNGHMRWTREPKSVTKGENETVTFECVGEGTPRPNPPDWYINWQSVSGNTADRVIGDQYGPSTTLTVKNLKKERDTMAIQCNITNFITGSWVFKSFYLNVQSERPTIVQFSEGLQKWAATKSYVLKCKIFGAPTPVISWKRNQQSLTGGRFVTREDGSLLVTDVGITDAGTYECSATNIHGTASMSTEVVVRRRTTIQQAPEDLTVTEGTQAKFVCTALTDPDEAQNLEITWLKDGKTMNYFTNNRVYRNVQDNSLQIAGPISIDSGLYTCRASNGIDSDEESATLRVQGKPDRPPTVSIEKCRATTAIVKWSPGTNNNAPLTSFTIQYQTALDESIWYTAVSGLAPKVTEYSVDMKPYNTYKFRVLAINKIGTSEPSDPTPTSCATSAARPPINPRGVRTLDEGDDRLVITWQPISPVDFGGTDFRYITRYKPADVAQCEGNKVYCEESQPAREGTIGRPGELNIIEYKTIVQNVATYKKYEITVISNNIEGDSADDITFVVGYSGEGNPRQDVTGFRLKTDEAGADMVYSDNATFIWTAVDESEAETQGFFRGYVIQYTKRVSEADDEHFDTRSIYVILRDVKKEGQPLEERIIERPELGAFENTDDKTVTVTITHLPANSDLDFQIAVVNKRRYGTLTSFLPVTTKEGAPGPVQQLRISENGPTHVRLTWQRPLEPNGVLTQYMIGFKSLNGLQLGPMQFPDSQYVAEPTDSSQRMITAKVTGLKPLQMYRFYVWAYTAAGQGSEYFIDDSTVAADYPDPPLISVERLSNSTLNVSWTAANTGVPANVFYVQYKQESAIDQWQRTGWETNKNYIMVSNFVAGWRYELMVVASNGGIYETGSESVKIFPTATSRAAAEATAVFSSSWFIGMLFALILVCIFIALLCVIQQNRGGIYTGQFAVEETERLKPYNEESRFDEKSGRGEPVEPEMAASERYAPSHFSDRYPQSQHSEKYAPSQHSERYVGSQPPPVDEYMQDDPNKYGEEGSFIGQYRDNKELPNFKPRPQDPYRPPAQPQARSRAPPSEAMYGGAPVPEPRNGGYSSRSATTPTQPPPRQARNTAAESSAEYRPQYGARTAPSYSPETRYRPVAPPAQDIEIDTNDTVV